MPNYVANKNSSFIFYMGVVSQADTKLLQTNPTIAAGDFKVSTDGGALANLTTLPVVTPAGSTAIKFTLSATEMNGDNIYIQLKDAAGAEWCDNFVNIITVPPPANLVQIDGTVNASATLNLKKLNVVNSSGDAAVFSSTGSNGKGINASGNGSGSGILTTGGTTGQGLEAVGGNTSGAGISAYATTFGSGMDLGGKGSGASGLVAQGDTAGNGFYLIGDTSGSGLRIVGGATGNGITTSGGATSGAGFYSAAVGSGTGITAVGVGTVSILATQGISGPLDASERNSIADALLKRDMSAVTGEASRSFLNCLRFIRNKWSIVSSTITITKEDDSTPAWTATLSTDATAAPIVGFDGN